METKHTPGPWSNFNDPELKGVYCEGYKYPVAKACSYWDGPGPRTDEAQANARLIAAAPELLEALKAVSAIASGESMTKRALEDALRLAVSAISKATGA